ncbi:hypothetical protein INT80_14580 [Gallibacterium anatis]|uniref:Uncharacterized protein n=1 Tax=Gallibacterium anatis TaxID=750 RepID=A0A930Y5K5_9PAST|nr:hypothetical protein [Gallibacterium anatis]
MQNMMLVPQGSLEGYIRAANEYPMLTEEEKELAERCIIIKTLMPLKN